MRLTNPVVWIFVAAIANAAAAYFTTPYTTAGGKTVNVRVQRVDNPNVVAIRLWGARERVGVKRATCQPGEPG